MTFDDLPLFPLDVVLYPGEALPLHVFEPRYRAMIARCLRLDEPFGLVLARAGGDVARVGCAARIERIVERYDDGRLDLVARGEARVEIHRVVDRHAYRSAEASLLPESEGPVDASVRERVVALHMRLVELAGRSVRMSLYATPLVSYAVAHNAGLDTAQKQDVLELPGEDARLAYLAAHLEALLVRVEQVDEVRRKVRSNGHFRDFLPDDDGMPGD